MKRYKMLWTVINGRFKIFSSAELRQGQKSGTGYVCLLKRVTKAGSWLRSVTIKFFRLIKTVPK